MISLHCGETSAAVACCSYYVRCVLPETLVMRSCYECNGSQELSLRSCKRLCRLRFLPRSMVRSLNASVDSWIPAPGQPFCQALATGPSPDRVCQQSTSGSGISVLRIWADIQFLVNGYSWFLRRTRGKVMLKFTPPGTLLNCAKSRQELSLAGHIYNRFTIGKSLKITCRIRYTRRSALI